jgi:hypothetical protein
MRAFVLTLTPKVGVGVPVVVAPVTTKVRDVDDEAEIFVVGGAGVGAVPAPAVVETLVITLVSDP